jgi:hypothetical protein
MKAWSACAAVLLALPALTQPAAPAAAPPAPLVNRHRVAELLQKLDHDRFDTRQRADQALRQLGKPALPLLRAELERTTSVEVRYRLKRMVHDLTIDERLPDLIQQLGHSRPEFRALAGWELRQAGVAVVPLLEKQLEAGLDGERRKQLEKIIAELSPSRAR